MPLDYILVRGKSQPPLVFIFLIVNVLCMASATTLVGVTDSTCQATFDKMYPRQYVAYRTDTPIVIDGILSEKEWSDVAWSDAFVDISTTTAPEFITKMKIRYDESFLYVAGYLEEPHVWANISTTCHCIDPNEDQVIFHDNDFEVFIDVDGTTHWYKEFEMNALSATWDLLLNRPYDDGGGENSSRVFGPEGFDMVPLLKAAATTDGIVNNPAVKATHWVTEIAFPISKLLQHTTGVPPTDKKMWRINFSRVEWKSIVVNGVYQKQPSCQSCPVPGTADCDNWSWSPQHAIAMHHPEVWGFLQFSEGEVNGTQPLRNEEWEVRFTAVTMYYALHAYAAKNNGTYTTLLSALMPFVQYPELVSGDCAPVGLPQISVQGSNFAVVVRSQVYSNMACNITQDRKMIIIS